MLLDRYIKLYPNFLSLETTSVLIRFAASRNFEKARIGKHGILDEEVRKVLSYPIEPRSKSLTDCHWANFLNYKIVSVMQHYLKEQKFLDFGNIYLLNQLDLLKYDKDHHYSFHVDHGINMNSNRTLSAILFLNNDYKGGELCFKNTYDDEQKIVNPIPGTLIIWPSNMLFPHMVKPVIEGVRYTVVAWG